MFLRAELLRETGRDSAAAVWYRVAADGVWHRGPALLALADIRGRLGATEEAADLYRRVLRLWEGGDADLELSLDLARRRLEELSR